EVKNVKQSQERKTTVKNASFLAAHKTGQSPVTTGVLLLVSRSLHGCCRRRELWHRRVCWRGHGLDPDGCDSMAVHFFYYETAALIVERLAAFGHLLQPGEYKTVQRLDAFVVRKVQLVLS